MAIDYRELYARALDSCHASQLFPDLAPAMMAHLQRIDLPSAGCMYDLARCTKEISEAISSLPLRHPGALFLLVCALLTESSSHAGAFIYAADTQWRPPAFPSARDPITASAAAAATANPLRNLAPSAQIDYIMRTLKEVDSSRGAIANVLKRRGADGAWELLQETGKAFQEKHPSTLKEDGTPRTVGGYFLRLEKNMAGKDKTAQVITAAPPAVQLRAYQLRAVERIMASGGNFVVAAPTGSGKTAIFVEVARRILRANGAANVCVVVPTVALTDQQCAQFIKDGDDFGPGKWHVESYSGQKQLLPLLWTATYRMTRVIVCTAQVLANALDSGHFAINQLDLLVLDECHHVTGDHPYSAIVVHYEKNAAAHIRTKILGVSASPVNGGCQTELELGMRDLLHRLRAELIPIEEDLAEVADVIARPKERDVRVASRPEDAASAGNILNFLHVAALTVGGATMDAVSHDSASAESQAEVAEQIEVLKKALLTTSQPGGRGIGQALTRLEQWNTRASKMASRLSLTNLGLCCQLITYGCRALALVEDAGYEAALQYLARKCCGLSIKYRQLQAGQRLAGGLHGSGYGPTGTSSGSNGGFCAADSVDDFMSCVEDDKESEGEEEEGSLRALRDHARNGPSAADVLAEVQGRGAAEARRRNERCPDITATSVAELAEVFLGSERLNSTPLLTTVQSGVFLEDQTFPKFWALKEYLLEYRRRPNGFHGIVFVATRQVVYFLSDTIRRCRDLSFVDVCEVKGHNDTSNNKLRNSDATTQQQRDRHTTGMSGARQQQAIAAFREPGFKLLVATSAVEEGIDVPNCEFVVRYNAAATGTQRLQSRGRARALASSEFVCLLQEHTLDQHLHHKSEQEEASMKEFMRHVAEAQRGRGGGAQALGRLCSEGEV